LQANANRMKATLTFVFCIASTLISYAQLRGTVFTQVKNNQQKPLEGITVQLLRQKDSVIAKLGITDAEGKATLVSVALGDYYLRYVGNGFETTYSAPFSLSEQQTTYQVPPQILQPQAKDIGAVTVTARKPFIQRLSDRTVLNVESSILSAGSSGFELLERAPGVVIDQNDVISLSGKQGVLVMIDGKISPLSGADLANYLRGLPSGSIERIDLITNPSAKYDAAGNAGIIDIRLKKDQRLGTNGTLNTFYGQGVYAKVGAGVALNYRNKKVNVFGSNNTAYRKGLNQLFLDRNFYTNAGQFTGSDYKDNYGRFPILSNNFRLGADYFPSKRTVVGVVLNGSGTGIERMNDNNAVVFDQQGKPASTFYTIATNNDFNNNLVGNLNFKHSFDSLGQELTADFDYGSYWSGSNAQTGTKYFKNDGTTLAPDYVLDGVQRGSLKLQSFKTDYVRPLKKQSKLEAGFKWSKVNTDNDAKFFDVSNGTRVVDASKTNHFLYEEQNVATYVNYAKQWKQWNVQLGLRAERTALHTYQAMGNVAFDSNYLQLFPSAFVNRQIGKQKTIGFSISRRIDRPSYNQLNPFLFLIDVTTYATGNPNLLPQFTWNYEVNYNTPKLNATLTYSKTDKVLNTAIVRFKDAFPNLPSDDNVTVQLPINISTTNYVGLTLSSPLKVKPWWSILNNANVFYSKFNGQLAGTRLDNGRAAINLNSTNNFTFKNGWSMEVSGNFNSGGRSGFMVVRSVWSANFGVQKQVLNNKGTLRLNVTDIFWTNRPGGTITYNNYIEKWYSKRETRVATISFNYRFGKNSVAQARRRTTASEEERNRAQ